MEKMMEDLRLCETRETDEPVRIEAEILRELFLAAGRA